MIACEHTLRKTKYLKAELNDKRLTKRFNHTLNCLKNNPSGSIAQASQSRAASEGAYRFFLNPKTKHDKLIESHVRSLEFENKSKKSLPQPPRYLCLSDSTELDYSKKRGALEMGFLTTKKRKGLILHNSLIVNKLGIPLGLLEQTYICRNLESFAKWKQRKNAPIQEKESIKWLHHFELAQKLSEEQNIEMIFVGDRESDIMDIYHARKYEHMHFLIRSQHNRCTQQDGIKLNDLLAKQPWADTYRINIIDSITLKPRTAILSVRFNRVTFKLSTQSKCKKHLTPIEVTTIEVLERNPPKDVEKPIRWILNTSLEIDTFKEALQVIEYYTLRWLIERFHFLLKSGGAKIEELQMEKTHQLKNAITTYSIAIMDIMKIRYLAENQPDTNVFEAGVTLTECKALYIYAQKRIRKSIVFDEKNPPTVWEFCRLLGKLGGFRPTKRQPLPGLKILSRALEKYYIILDTYIAIMSKN